MAPLPWPCSLVFLHYTDQLVLPHLLHWLSCSLQPAQVIGRREGRYHVVLSLHTDPNRVSLKLCLFHICLIYGYFDAAAHLPIG